MCVTIGLRLLAAAPAPNKLPLSLPLERKNETETVQQRRLYAWRVAGLDCDGIDSHRGHLRHFGFVAKKSRCRGQLFFNSQPADPNHRLSRTRSATSHYSQHIF